MILVTGATGHIGNVLVRKLLEKKYQVKVLVLPNDDLNPIKGLEAEHVEGNILDYNSLNKALQGVRVVFHLAGIISIESGRRKLLHKVNVEGTKNIIRACLANNIEKLIYTSSIHALKEPPKGTIIDESQPFIKDKSYGVYNETKAEASLEILKAIKDGGLKAVIACPTGVTGPYDYKISQMGQLYIDCINGKLKAYLDGSYDYADVRDVALGLISIYERGKIGEKYILSGEKISVSRILNIVARETNISPPKFKFPTWLALTISPLAYLYYKILKLPPLFTSYSIKTLNSNSDISHDKASRELGYNSRPVEESIIDSIRWFRKNGFIKY